MSPASAKKNMEIIKAYANGKTVQVKRTDGFWHDLDVALFLDRSEYRIKPEPRTGWINIYKDPFDMTCYTSRLIYETKNRAQVESVDEREHNFLATVCISWEQ